MQGTNTVILDITKLTTVQVELFWENVIEFLADDGFFDRKMTDDVEIYDQSLHVVKNGKVVAELGFDERDFICFYTSEYRVAMHIKHTDTNVVDEIVAIYDSVLND